MLKFLLGRDVAKRVRASLDSGESADLAVAFWGRGACERLGIARGRNIRIICNLDHIGTNPDEIEKIRDYGIKIKKCDNLHAKIYFCKKFAIVGSSNASTNGLFEEDGESGGWIEGNAMTDEVGFLEQVGAFFNQLWEKSSYISTEDIVNARVIRKRYCTIPAERNGIFKSCIKFPYEFSNYYIVCYNKNLSERASVIYDNQFLMQNDIDCIPHDKLGAYELGNIKEGAVLIDLDMTQKKPKSGGIYNVICNAIEYDDIDGEYLVPVIKSSEMLTKKERKFLIDNALEISKLPDYEKYVINLNTVLTKLKYS